MKLRIYLLSLFCFLIKNNKMIELEQFKRKYARTIKSNIDQIFLEKHLEYQGKTCKFFF